MVRRFNLADILLLKRLQDRVACLDLELALLWSPAPLSLALLECLAWNQSRSATFVADEHPDNRHPQGFIQACDRPDRLSCDVEFVAPALDGSDSTAHLWRRLLDHLSVARGESGLQRIFAAVPETGPASEVFRQSGFGAYARRHVLRLDQLQFGADQRFLGVNVVQPGQHISLLNLISYIDQKLGHQPAGLEAQVHF